MGNKNINKSYGPFPQSSSQRNKHTQVDTMYGSICDSRGKGMALQCLGTATESGKDLLEEEELKLGFIGYVKFQPEKTKGQRISRSMNSLSKNECRKM